MPNKVAIVTDSTAYLSNEYLKQYNITITPLSVIWGEDVYRDGVDILPDEFYRRLSTAKVMPTTSQVAIVTMKDAFEKLLAEGYEVLGIFISSKLSGTMQSAIQAKEMLPKAAEKIVLVDSMSTAMAMGFHVLTAARAAQSGEKISECKRPPGRSGAAGRAEIPRAVTACTVAAPRRAYNRATTTGEGGKKGHGGVARQRSWTSPDNE